MIFKKKKVMKKLIRIAAFIGVIAIIGSCKKDVTETPLSAVSVNVYFRSVKDITASLAGIYGSFQEEMTGDGTGKDEGYGGRYHYWGEARSDNFDRSQYVNNTETEMAFNALTINNAATDWSGLYRTISNANLAIQYIPQVPKYDPNATPLVINNAMAQCYALRAESYFYIVRLWGAAPMWTTPYLDATKPSAKPRTASATLIDSLIIPDLQKAYSLIQKNQTATVWYIGEGAICAILADVYMWRAGQPGGGQSDYQNAIAWTKKLFLAKGPTGAAYAGATGANLETTANWKNMFLAPAGSIESIWNIAWDNTVNGCACIPVSTQLSNNPVKVDSVIYFNWKAIKADTRLAKTLDTAAVATIPSTSTGHQDKLLKYYNAATGGDLVKAPASALTWNVYLVMYRLGDVYLSYAEALNQTGDGANALRYLNYIRVRAGVPVYTAAQLPTTLAMQNAILQERQYELFGEGKRWFDLVRTNNVQNIMSPVVSRRQKSYGTAQTGFADLNKVLWPLSQYVLNANSLLIQNPSY
ncbi:MAG: RagB/SusD family nutrient uptake outer membrane protein [Mucilaginibacter sp.]|nr:RagB/SusD family nutrient uptake outer membrane protein [Mucilaginibacter sp.]